MNSNEGRGPSVAEIQRFIREGVLLEFIIIGGGSIRGKLRWFDDQAFSVKPDGSNPITVLRHSVVGYRVAEGSGEGVILPGLKN